MESGSSLIGGSGAKKPRAHLTYEVFLDGAQKKVEIDYVVGVFSDLSGKAKLDGRTEKEKAEASKFLTDPAKRQFVEFTDSKDLDAKMAVIRPVATVEVPNVLANDGTTLKHDFEFRSLKDFSPDEIVKKHPALAEYYRLRERIRNLLSYLDGKPDAEKAVRELYQDLEKLMKK